MHMTNHIFQSPVKLKVNTVCWQNTEILTKTFFVVDAVPAKWTHNFDFMTSKTEKISLLREKKKMTSVKHGEPEALTEVASNVL